MSASLSTLPYGGRTDPREPVVQLMRDLGTGPGGLSSLEAARRLERFGANQLPARDGLSWPGQLLRQFIHPLAVLLLLAAVLARVAGTPQLFWAILAVVVLNAGFLWDV